MKMKVRNLEELRDFVEEMPNNPDDDLVRVEVNLDGNTFEIDYIELDNDDVIRIHLEL